MDEARGLPAGQRVGLAQVLEVLFDAPVAQRILLQVDALRATSDPTPSLGNLMPARTERLAPRQRCFELAIHPLASEMERQVVLLLSDVSERQELKLALEEARATRDLALVGAAHGCRCHAHAARVGRGRVSHHPFATLRLPARSQEGAAGKTDSHAARGRRTRRTGAGALPHRPGHGLRGADRGPGGAAAEGSAQWRRVVAVGATDRRRRRGTGRPAAHRRTARGRACASLIHCPPWHRSSGRALA